MTSKARYEKFVSKILLFPGKTLNNELYLFIALLLICLSGRTTYGLQCYTCTFIEADIDDSCLLDPRSTLTTNCSKKYCTIMRQEAVSPAGKVISFIRDCQDKPLFLNTVKIDPTFKTYYRSCVTDLCNDMDGTHAATHIDPNFGASENTIVKGKSSSLPRTKNDKMPMLASLLIVFLYK